MSRCPADHETRDITQSRCTLCGGILRFQLQASMEKPGTPEFNSHVRAELAGFIAHLEHLSGLTLNAAERAEATEIVTNLMLKFAR